MAPDHRKARWNESGGITRRITDCDQGFGRTWNAICSKQNERPTSLPTAVVKREGPVESWTFSLGSRPADSREEERATQQCSPKGRQHNRNGKKKKKERYIRTQNQRATDPGTFIAINRRLDDYTAGSNCHAIRKKWKNGLCSVKRCRTGAGL